MEPVDTLTSDFLPPKLWYNTFLLFYTIMSGIIYYSKHWKLTYYLSVCNKVGAPWRIVCYIYIPLCSSLRQPRGTPKSVWTEWEEHGDWESWLTHAICTWRMLEIQALQGCGGRIIGSNLTWATWWLQEQHVVHSEIVSQETKSWSTVAQYFPSLCEALLSVDLLLLWSNAITESN